ncbi:cyclophilin-like fold protein [Rathayibacter sp. VKM Ac-2754]|uniref:cyclophilin-like fold protein n=1 Tax=Rathayibacter sp. VKM Ac-2754 TaxID=2609251 RepID=UPI00194EAB17|nr:cyclophilin-like fold protein [Rathayibacter sp. VKM Ac-2754]
MTAITIEFENSPAARSIATGLPASLVFEDRMGAALVAEDVTVSGALASAEAVAHYRAGDVVWSPTHRELVVFTHDGSGVGDAALVRVGTVRSGLADLEDCVLDCELKVSSVESESREGIVERSPRADRSRRRSGRRIPRVSAGSARASPRASAVPRPVGGSRSLTHGGRSAGDAHTLAVGCFDGSGVSGGRAFCDEVEGRPARHLDRVVRVMRQHEDGCVIRRFVAPPAAPFLVPTTSDRAEPVAAHHVRPARAHQPVSGLRVRLSSARIADVPGVQLDAAYSKRFLRL